MKSPLSRGGVGLAHSGSTVNTLQPAAASRLFALSAAKEAWTPLTLCDPPPAYVVAYGNHDIQALRGKLFATFTR